MAKGAKVPIVLGLLAVLMVALMVAETWTHGYDAGYEAARRDLNPEFVSQLGH